MMRVIGTAGHVDHGKSTLVQALTGTHPDRLKEEREREMTIDLGFAFLNLPGGEEVGIVDVPGHRDFIENMLAGVGGIDAALFVVAADEGVMPQTREHLAILNLLQVQGGVVALTKTDVVDDPDWLDLVEEDLQTTLLGTVLEDAPIVRVSAKTMAGIPDLELTLANCLAERPPRPDLGRPRLPVDRVFTIAGFGTVVTGTLTDGHFETGQEVETQPGGVRGRIRGLQSHNRKERVAVPGSRTAVNISGVNLGQVRRGEWVAVPGHYRPTRRLDLQFHQLSGIQPVKHNMEVKFFIGTAEILGRLRLLGTEELPPGQDGWIQVELRGPVVAVRGDRYILRRPSPGETLGGGMVVDPHPEGRHKRFSPQVIERLEALAGGAPEDILLQAALSLGAAAVREVVKRSTLGPDVALGALEGLLASGEIAAIEESPPRPETLIAPRSYWERIVTDIIREVTSYHQQNPLRMGIPREELKSRLQMDARLFNASVGRLAAGGELAGSETLVWEPGHTIRFSPNQERAVARLITRSTSGPFAPPSVKEARAEVGAEVYAALVDLGRLVQVSADVVFRKEDYDRLVNETKQILAREGDIEVAGFRDRFRTSRKYALAFLEHLDTIGVTVRVGDVRKLKFKTIKKGVKND